MGRNGVFGQLSGIDAFGRTMDDVRIRTNIGALITLTSFALIAILTLGEFLDYRRWHEDTQLVVDKNRGERLAIHLNITFPRVPCYLLSIDVMDISGETQVNLMHDIDRTRIHEDGSPVETKKGLSGEANRVAAQHKPDYCGSCYGGDPGESGCCNTCDEVQEAYNRRGWSFADPEHIDQCVKEHWTEKIKEQNKEGCNVAGYVHVNKVIGNLHLSPGRAFQRNSVLVHDLVPYLSGKDAQHHDFGHTIHELSFEDGNIHIRDNDADVRSMRKQRLGITEPLNGIHAHSTGKSQYMYQYFLKVVATELKNPWYYLKSYQYSVTTYERDLEQHDGSQKNQQQQQQQQQSAGKMAAQEGPGRVSHGFVGMPGVFFNFDIAGLKMVKTESRKSLAHFLTSTCAIVGGVLTVAGILDAAVHAGRLRMGMSSQAGGSGMGGGYGWDGSTGGARMGSKLI